MSEVRTKLHQRSLSFVFLFSLVYLYVFIH